MTRKLIALIMALCLLCGAAMAEGNNLNLYPYDYSDRDGVRAGAIASIGDTLYILISRNEDGSRALAEWSPGMAEPAIVTELPNEDDEDWSPYFNFLLTDGEDLYGLNFSGGELTRLTDNGTPVLERVVKIDTSAGAIDNGDYMDYGQCISLFAQDGMVYSMNLVWDNNGNETRNLLGFSMETGECVLKREDEALRTVAPYKDGQLLAFYLPGGKTYDEEAGEELPLLLATYDPQTGSATTLGTVAENSIYNVGYLCYDQEKDNAYYCNAGVVYTLPGVTGAPVVSAYLPIQTYGEDSPYFAVLTSGVCAFAYYECLYIRQMDAPGVENGALMIYGEYGGDMHSAVMKDHPEMNIQLSDKYFDGIEELTAAMVSGDGSLDLLQLNTSYTPLTQLIAKGYAADVSTMADVMAVMDRMDSRFTEPFMVDGKLYAVPVSASTNVVGYVPEVAEALGIDPADLPKTFVELLDFCANFYYDYGEENPEYTLFSDLNLRNMLFGKLVTLYIAYEFKNNGEENLSFDTPLFRKLLAALDAIDFTEIDPYATLGDDIWQDDDAIYEFYEKDSLFTTTSASPDSYRNSRYDIPMVLALDEGLEPVIPVSLDVFIVNPRTTRMDQATLYLGEYVKHYSQERENITFFPDNNDPVPNIYYESNMRYYNDYIAELESRLEAAADENKAEVQAELDEYLGYRDEYENDRMALTAENIAEYREALAPYLYVMPQTPLTDYSGEGNSEIQTQISQYIDGAIDADTFIREVDKRVRMMMLENQ